MAWTNSLWRGCVVRTKSLLVRLEFCVNACQSAARPSPVGLGRFVVGLRGLLDFLAVFIEAGEKKNILPRLRRARAMTSVMIFS